MPDINLCIVDRYLCPDFPRQDASLTKEWLFRHKLAALWSRHGIHTHFAWGVIYPISDRRGRGCLGGPSRGLWSQIVHPLRPDGVQRAVATGGKDAPALDASPPGRPLSTTLSATVSAALCFDTPRGALLVDSVWLAAPRRSDARQGLEHAPGAGPAHSARGPHSASTRRIEKRRLAHRDRHDRHRIEHRRSWRNPEG